MISIIITTNKRNDHIVQLLQSIAQCKNNKYEIILLDQNADHTLEMFLQNQKTWLQKIHYVRLPNNNLSNARNEGLKLAKNNIIAFTDDDCIISKTWLDTIEHTFKNYSDIDGVFGKTYPYKPNTHHNKICPCTFNPSNSSYTIETCRPHYESIGYGNNMAFRKKVFDKNNIFSTWLGVGSLGLSAEDAEFALRLLLQKHKLTYCPNMIVYHNKWLSKSALLKQTLSYTCGEMACYGYFTFQKFHFAQDVLQKNILNSKEQIKLIIRSLIHLRWNHMLYEEVAFFYLDSIYKLRGLILGCFYALVRPIARYKN